MTSVSYFLDQDTIRGIEAIAKEKGLSESNVVREIYHSYELQRSLTDLQIKATPLAPKLGIKSEDDVEGVFG